MKLKIIFLAEIRERELISKNICKYLASLDYFDKSLNVFSILSESISIASFASVVGGLAGITGANCGLTLSTTSGFVKTFLKTIRNKKKKHNKIVILARSKLNSTESKMTVCSCHVTYAFQSESTLYSCLNVKELLARSRRQI